MDTITFYTFLHCCLRLEAEQTPAPGAILEALRAVRREEDTKAAAPPKPPRARDP